MAPLTESTVSAWSMCAEAEGSILHPRLSLILTRYAWFGVSPLMMHLTMPSTTHFTNHGYLTIQTMEYFQNRAKTRVLPSTLAWSPSCSVHSASTRGDLSSPVFPIFPTAPAPCLHCV